jgi:hypothetical protein
MSHRMLHFEPVLDENGKPVFESPNVVKQEPSPLEHTVSYFDDIVITSTTKPTYEETLKEHFKKNIWNKLLKDYVFMGQR